MIFLCHCIGVMMMWLILTHVNKARNEDFAMTKNVDTRLKCAKWYIVGCQAICLDVFFFMLQSLIIVCDIYGLNDKYNTWQINYQSQYRKIHFFSILSVFVIKQNFQSDWICNLWRKKTRNAWYIGRSFKVWLRNLTMPIRSMTKYVNRVAFPSIEPKKARQTLPVSHGLNNFYF